MIHSNHMGSITCTDKNDLGDPRINYACTIADDKGVLCGKAGEWLCTVEIASGTHFHLRCDQHSEKFMAFGANDMVPFFRAAKTDKKCNCDLHVMMRLGCKCGGI